MECQRTVNFNKVHETEVTPEYIECLVEDAQRAETLAETELGYRYQFGLGARGTPL
jgi:hypothetical protein